LNVLAALAWIFGGAWLTAGSWRRAKFLIDRLDGADVAPEAVASGVIASRPATHPSWDRREVGAAPVGPRVRG